MLFSCARLAALAIALLWPAIAGAQGTAAAGDQPASTEATGAGAAPQPAKTEAQGTGAAAQPAKQAPKAGIESQPVQIDADRLEGTTGKESSAEGNAILRRDNVTIHADSLKYNDETQQVDAQGNVRYQRDGDVITGPAVRYRLNDATGNFEKPDFSLAPRSKGGLQPVTGRGQAESIEFVGENQYKIKDGYFTTCKPGDNGWLVRAGELDLDFNRQVGTAHDATLVFEGVSLPGSPTIDFSLNNQRKSGFLPPSFGTSGKSGPEFSEPYYLNLAPNYDLTLTPRYMEKRGTQVAGQFRFLEPNYNGILSAEYLPDDRAANQTRSLFSLVETYKRDGFTGGLNLNKVSDDNYFRDLSTRINLTSQAVLPREGFLTYSGSWWGTGSYSTTARIQQFQILQDPENPIVTPYGRAPQITWSSQRQDIAGFDFSTAAEFVDFTHPTQVIGKRTTVYPSMSFPVISPGYFFTPKVGVNATYYSLDHNAADTPDTISRVLPIYSLDSGLIYQRDTQALGQPVTQTLEPRLYYVYIPFRDQNQIPLFDTAVADFNYAQIFSENMFAGGDRINDANQLTAAVTSRLLLPSSGQEMMRGTFGQRYYFKDQQVTLNPTDVPRTYSASNLLAALSGRPAPSWSMEAASEYDQRDLRTERLTFSARYRPESLKTLNLSYRYLSGDITQTGPVKQVDLSSQWPLGGRWYGVGRFNYSIPDARIVEAIGGLEYGADCWIARVVLQRFTLTAGSSTTTFFLQLELNGFSRIGSNPLEALKRNVAGYQLLNAKPQGAQQPDSSFDFYD
jgi:LPS-assembly protein